jgi:hypothetical protein
MVVIDDEGRLMVTGDGALARVVEGRPLGGMRAEVLRMLDEARRQVVEGAREQAIQALDRAKKALEKSRDVRVVEERRIVAPQGGQTRRMVIRRENGESVVEEELKGLLPVPPAPPKTPKALKPPRAPKPPKAPEAPVAPAPSAPKETAGMGGLFGGLVAKPIERVRVVAPAERGGEGEFRAEVEQLRRELDDLRQEIRALRANPAPTKKGRASVEPEQVVPGRRIERL